MKGRAEGAQAQQRGGTFTGAVWGDPLMPPSDGVMMNTVYFSPGARTYWHRHEGGQVIHVTSGQGWVVERGGSAARVRNGDTVWAPPGEEHWHGAAADAFMVHVAVSMGQTEWLEEVSSQDFQEAAEAYARSADGKTAGPES